MSSETRAETSHIGSGFAVILSVVSGFNIAALNAQAARPREETLTLPGKVGVRGGRLVVALRSEPKTLNPLTAIDVRSKDVIALLSADLIHINVESQKTEPALAKAWKVSPDGKTYTLQLRQGIFFSDGHPFDADDVVFSFKVYLDEKVGSPRENFLTWAKNQSRSASWGLIR